MSSARQQKYTAIAIKKEIYLPRHLPQANINRALGTLGTSRKQKSNIVQRDSVHAPHMISEKYTHFGDQTALNTICRM